MIGKKTIFDYTEYRSYLLNMIEQQPAGGRGFRTQMANAMGCQKGYVSKILDDRAGFEMSLEQAEKLNALLGHSRDEANYFYLMIQYARAGSPTLKSHFREQMKAMLARRLEVAKELQSRTVLSHEDHMRYYGDWYYSAIRVAVSIPQLQSIEALSRALRISREKVISALEFLVSRGLVEKEGTRYFHEARQQIMLSADHLMTNLNHMNYRLKALRSLEDGAKNDLHYTYTCALSEEDVLKLRLFLVETIKEISARVAPSKEEALYTFCLDFFELADTKLSKN